MLDLVIDARKADLGNGLEVRRILPFRSRRMVGPFIFLDHAGPLDLPPEELRKADVRPHPHIGLSTVSYLFGGQITHRDSLGVEQVIRPGEVNWMTAGRGIAHSERFEDPAALAGGALEMLQTWVALPEADEESAPAFDNYQPDKLPIFTEGGLWMRLIAGERLRPQKLRAHALAALLRPRHPAARRDDRPAARPLGTRRLCRQGPRLRSTGRDYAAGQMLVFTRDADPAIVADEASTVMLLGGEPVGRALHLVEFRVVAQGADRGGQGRLEGRPHPAAAQRQSGVHRAARGAREAARARAAILKAGKRTYGAAANCWGTSVAECIGPQTPASGVGRPR